jgi:membrane protease YdiL (CAAX protease family)
MIQIIPADVTAVIRITSLIWVFLTTTILVAGDWWQSVRDFRDRMLLQWRPALVIALLYALGAGIGGVGFFQLSTLAKFCQAWIGLTLAYGIIGFEPLPVKQAIVHKSNWRESIWGMLGAALVVALAALLVNGILSGVFLKLFGETMRNSQGVESTFPSNPLQSFFLLLAGAGLAEETTYRLLCLPLFWRLTGRPRVAILLSAILFGAYHLSPLDGLYLQYWERPLTIFFLSTIMGIVMGYVYVKRGFETAVLGHTLGDWIPFMLSRMV